MDLVGQTERVLKLFKYKKMARKKPSKVHFIDGVKVHIVELFYKNIEDRENPKMPNNPKQKSCEFFTLPPSFDSKNFRMHRSIKHGPFKRWDSKGDLMTEIHYVKGIEHGFSFFTYTDLFMFGRREKRNVFLHMNKGLREGEGVDYAR